ncbi:hypothetical protein [uncultured Microbacterium sp.]|uniref:hypothetical protein n=1 Tax=uncultured Microbacterium sp. TaxID=191216 RepID=UPI002609E491|nr:hypothetical protein [uncultured Microbacterium sp.]
MPLGPRDRLRLWDAAAGMHPVDAAVRCLAVARPDIGDPAGIPLGERDAALLALRQELLGDRLTARALCPACGEEAAMELSIAALLPRMVVEPEWRVNVDGRPLAVRALTSRDAAAAVRAASPEDARTSLVRAMLAVAPEDADPDETTADLVAASLAEHDRGAEISLALTCAGCGAEWDDVFDVAVFVTAELAHHGLRLLADVAELAGAFGWSEDAILELSDHRRRAYLTLAAG